MTCFHLANRNEVFDNKFSEANKLAALPFFEKEEESVRCVCLLAKPKATFSCRSLSNLFSSSFINHPLSGRDPVCLPQTALLVKGLKQCLIDVVPSVPHYWSRFSALFIRGPSSMSFGSPRSAGHLTFCSRRRHRGVASCCSSTYFEPI